MIILVIAIIYFKSKNGRGGSIALLQRGHLLVKKCTSTSFNLFEHMLVKIASVSVTYHLVLIYRPPLSRKIQLTTPSFFEDFEKLMSEVILLKGKLLVLGNFNIHINDVHSSDLEVLQPHGCFQLGPAYQKSNISTGKHN